MELYNNKIKNLQYHKDLQKLCTYVSVDDYNEIPTGYYELHDFDNLTINNKSGFYAKVFTNGDEVIIVYNATDINFEFKFHIYYIKNIQESAKDIFNDLELYFSKIPAQTKDAMRLYEAVNKKYPVSKITLTGFSLGGSLAHIVSIKTGCFATSYSAIGVRSLFKKYMRIGDENIVNYVNGYDFWAMHKALDQVGKIYVVDFKCNDFSIKNNHMIYNLNLDTRSEITPILLNNRYKLIYKIKEDLQKNLNEFIDKHIEKISLSEKRIKDLIEYETKTLMEKSIKYYKTSCVGSYPVSDYNRSDGTHVNGYIRHCGAKHKYP